MSTHHRTPHHASAAYIAAQTGAGSLGLHAGEVYEIARPAPIWRRLAVLLAQFAGVAAFVVVVCWAVCR